MQFRHLKLLLLSNIVGNCLPLDDARSIAIGQSFVHEKRGLADPAWVASHRVEQDHILPVRIGLTQSNLHLGEDLIREISHPASPEFGKHKTKLEIDELFAPAAETIEEVLSWLTSNGIRKSRIGLTQSKNWMVFNATALEVENLLGTEYYWYEHARSGDRAVGCEEYSIPEALRFHIDFIRPGIHIDGNVLGNPRSARKRSPSKRSSASKREDPPFKPKPNDTTTCDRAITPACLRAMYNIPLNTLHHPDNALGIFETGDFYAKEDIDSFFTTFEPRVPNGTYPKLASIDGGQAPLPPDEADGESDLDLELATSLIYPQGIVLYQTDDSVYTVSGAGGLFNTFLDAVDASYCNYTAFGETGDDPNFDDVYPDNSQPGGYQGERQCGAYKLTNVVSISYSKQEADLPYYYQQRQCNEFMKLALQGHTILVASGDYGVSARNYDPDPNGCLGPNHTIFNPNFPSCPYITTVGATQLGIGKSVHDPEEAAYHEHHDGGSATYSSGGGFSNIYSIPDYQRDAVQNYFQNHDPGFEYYSALHNATANSTTPIGAGHGRYNRIGRGMPDVSANGRNIATYIDVTWKFGGYGLSEGTSASTPIFASIINNINELRLAAGKKPIGYLNHILYSHPEVFNDIVNGTNPGCGVYGFKAVPGWDPVTGLGTPIYPKLSQLLTSLP